MDDSPGKAGVVDIIATSILCICLLSISWLLSVWFERTMADESVVFGSLSLLLLVMLAFVFFEWRRHVSVWIAAIQGAVLSASAAIPVFRGEPDAEPLTGPLIIALFGAVLAATEAGLCWFIYQRRRTRASGVAAVPSNGQVQLVGIGGWLILPAIGVALNPVLGMVGLVLGLAAFNARYATYSIASLIFNAALLVWLCVIAVQFFKKKQALPHNFIQFMIWRPGVSLVLFILGIMVFGSTDELFLLRLLNANNFIAQGIAAAIWIPYFKVSKRVQATFIN